jgi:hypothetical protein
MTCHLRRFTAFVMLAGLARVLSAQPARPRFVPIQPELFAAGGALANAFADIDQDGDLDLFVGFNGKIGRAHV